MSWPCYSSYVDGRNCELLDYDTVQKHCFFEFIFINDKFTVFCRAWRKPLEPLVSTDNSSYPRRKQRDGEWTIQTDELGFFGDSWSCTIKENRSDSILMRDLNWHLSTTRRQFPDTPSYFFKQEYPDWDYDQRYQIKRVGYDESIVTRNDNERVVVLTPGDVVVHLNQGERVVKLQPNQIILTQNPNETWFKVFRGEKVVILKQNNPSECYDPWAAKNTPESQSKTPTSTPASKPPEPPKSKQIPKPKKDVVFHLSKKGFTARGRFYNGSFLIYAKSELDISFSPYSNAGKKRRKELLEQGIIKINTDGVAYLTKNTSFRSPNSAADFILGGVNKGGKLWLNEDGKTWDEYYKADE